MKHITLLASLALGMHLNAQTIVASSFENWTGTTPDGWVGSKTSLETDSIEQADQNILYGTYAVRLINAQNAHKRFTTQPVAVVGGETYEISFYARGAGDVRTGLFDGRPGGSSGYSPYNSYVTVSGATWTPYSQQVTCTNDTTDGEFILSTRNTMAAMGHLEIDSVRISVAMVAPPTNASVYQIQNTTDPNGDSPLLGQTVNTGGVVTGVAFNGYYIQSGSGPWSGVFVFDFNNTPLLGDSISITGVVDEFNSLTELKNLTAFTVVNGGNTIQSRLLPTGDVDMEQWEGVLVNVTSAECTALPDLNGQWTVNDGSGAILVDDLMYAFIPTVGVEYDVTGVVDYTFSEWKIEPRDMADVLLFTGIADNAFAGTALYPVPVDALLNVKLPISGLRYVLRDALGREMRSGSFGLFGAVNVSELANGAYSLSITDGKNTRVERVLVRH